MFGMILLRRKMLCFPWWQTRNKLNCWLRGKGWGFIFAFFSEWRGAQKMREIGAIQQHGSYRLIVGSHSCTNVFIYICTEYWMQVFLQICQQWNGWGQNIMTVADPLTDFLTVASLASVGVLFDYAHLFDYAQPSWISYTKFHVYTCRERKRERARARVHVNGGSIWLWLGAEVRKGIALETSRVLREIGYLLLRDSNTFVCKRLVAWSCGSSLDYLINIFATTQPPWGLVSFCRGTLLYPPATWSLVPCWQPTFDKRNCCPQPWLLHSCARTERWQRGVPWCWSTSTGIASWFSSSMILLRQQKATHLGHDGFFLSLNTGC